MANYQSNRRSTQEKHRARRAAILDAATDVMRREGVAACSVRRIAKAAGVSPSVIHYYFADAQEIVDFGYASITDRYFARLEAVRGTFSDPAADFWHLIAAYTEPWNAHPRMTLLWSEYYTMSGNNHRTSGIVESYQRTIDLFANFLAPIEEGRYVGRAQAVWRHLTGTIDSRLAIPIGLDEIFAELALVIGIPAPAADTVRCSVRACGCKG
ncbi:TetR/AcrR family transcriptional regulator [Nocardioides albidus]|uniref:TetR/AcrR family transcriptional regulator n=1 Tax=Nocardioides albidus TaxID=1517589 RepID=A0A5C4VRM5_9ACTN|nr:TetR/AcrR family transcriptional regulator [Nocardioides albidus]TNM38470.1 TetR/AcrR family transcriptional regulator [Nocardioides albidus]